MFWFKLLKGKLINNMPLQKLEKGDNMQIFIDTADVQKIRELNDYGLVDGVTTNPTLIKQAGRDHEKTIREISSFVKGPISVETLSENAEGMVKEAEEYIT
jgi:transaldolase